MGRALTGAIGVVHDKMKERDLVKQAQAQIPVEHRKLARKRGAALPVMPGQAPHPGVPPHMIPPEDTVISLYHVSKIYNKTLGMNDITVYFGKGITGLLGDNGSGKSTMFKVITGLLRPSAGMVRIMGQEPRNNPRVFRTIGYCPEDDAFYSGMSGLTYVSYFLQLNGFERRESDRRARIILEKLDLGDAADRPVDGYSKGMKQRIKLARAISTDPDILILDEPLQGTDPEARHLIIQNLKEWEKRGKTILISSHILREIESLTDTIVLLSRGRVLAKGNVHSLRRMVDSHPHTITLIPRDPAEARRLAAVLVEQDFVVSAGVEPSSDPRNPAIRENTVSVHTRDPGGFYRSIAGVLSRSGISIRHMSSRDDNLEALYHFLMWQQTGGGRRMQ